MVDRDRREHYDEVREALSFNEDIDKVLTDLITGEIAMDHFGVGTTTLDALCLLAWIEKEFIPRMLVERVRFAHDVEHYTWSAIADALGVSRQAVVKRFLYWD